MKLDSLHETPEKIECRLISHRTLVYLAKAYRGVPFERVNIFIPGAVDLEPDTPKWTHAVYPVKLSTRHRLHVLTAFPDKATKYAAVSWGKSGRTAGFTTPVLGAVLALALAVLIAAYTPLDYTLWDVFIPVTALSLVAVYLVRNHVLKILVARKESRQWPLTK